MRTVEKILNFQIIILRLPKQIEKSLSRMKRVHKSLAEEGISSPINDTITGVRKSKRTVIVSIFTLISFGNKDERLLWRTNFAEYNILEMLV